MSLLRPKGLLDPVWCKNKRWIIENAATTKGNKKWRPKNRVKVGFSTLNPPHNQITIISPNRGIAENRLGNTVAPQNDICPHGKT